MPELEKPGGLSYEFVLEEARTRRCETPNMKSPATPTPSRTNHQKNEIIAGTENNNTLLTLTPSSQNRLKRLSRIQHIDTSQRRERLV